MAVKRLTIDWSALEMAFDFADMADFGDSMECGSYLDLNTGEVVYIDEEIRTSVDVISDELDDEPSEGEDWSEDAIRNTETFRELSEDEQLSVLAAFMTEYGDSDRFKVIPHIESHESYQDMEDFIKTVDDDAKRNRLAEAISKPKPFRRFRDVLADDRCLERQWAEHEAASQRRAIIDWLHDIGVVPTNPGTVEPEFPPLPDLRNIMFGEVRRFVRFARDIPGVVRIALIGSLTTDKEFPKDIDLLITVSDDCDLAPLAKLGRQLSGHMTSNRAGADVFLAGEDNRYLGRTCPWKNCGPGYRASCDASHCGKRPFLHDDLNTIRLPEELITQPPVVLWPDLYATDTVPKDVREQLIDQLAKDGQR